MTEEINVYQIIATSVIKKTDISIVINDELDNASTDGKTIYLTHKSIPKEFRQLKNITEIFMDADCLHESIHWVLSFPLMKNLQSWIKRKTDPQLAQQIQNIQEDKRVDYFGINRWRFDLGKKLEQTNILYGKAWSNSLKEKIRNKEVDVNHAVFSLAELHGLFNTELDQEILDFIKTEGNNYYEKTINTIKEVKEILENGKFNKMSMRVVSTCELLYGILEEYKNQKNKENRDFKNAIPSKNGGNMPLIINAELKEEVEKLNEEIQNEKNKKDELSQKQTRGAGSVSGLQIKTPTPNTKHYQSLVNRNITFINQLLHMLKRKTNYQLQKTKYKKQGRLQTENLASIYASSFTKPIENIYEHQEFTVEKQKVLINLIVDLSGSVNLIDVQDALTIIAEVCVIPQTLLLTPNGLKKANELKIGDLVLTHKGRFRQINQIFIREHNGEILHIVSTYNPHVLSVTENHPILAVKRNDVSLIPKWYNACDLDKGDLVAYPIRREVIDREGITNDLARLIGYFIADGCCSHGLPYRISFGFEITQKNYIEDVLQIAQNIFGKNGKKIRRGRAIEITFNSKDMDSFFKQFGRYAWGKDLPEWFIKLPEEKLKEFIKGYWRGDGTKRKKGFGFATTSEFLAIKIKQILHKLNILPHIGIAQPKSKYIASLGKWIQGRHPVYLFEMNGSNIDPFGFIVDINHEYSIKRNRRWIQGFITKKYALSPIKKIESSIRKTKVFNFSIEEDQSYIANDVTTHNCGKWLLDEDFGIWVFGSNFQRIKTHVEAYYNTKERIGGTTYMGGTVLLKPLQEIHKVINGITNNRKKIVVIVSDFDVSNSEECKNEIARLEADNITVIGIGINYSDLNTVKAFTRENSTFINGLSELPQKFFDIYSALSL